MGDYAELDTCKTAFLSRWLGAVGLFSCFLLPAVPEAAWASGRSDWGVLQGETSERFRIALGRIPTVIVTNTAQREVAAGIPTKTSPAFNIERISVFDHTHDIERPIFRIESVQVPLRQRRRMRREGEYVCSGGYRARISIRPTWLRWWFC
jgi:hypothetical protein